jgi:vacuolar-type H+-ATPase subunit E/Vma4
MASAQQEADEIAEKAEAEAQAELERRSARLRDENERKVALAKGEADTRLETAVTTRRAECAMKILKAKNQVLDAVFEQAQQQMLNSEGVDYNAWLTGQVRQAVDAG